MSRQRTWTWSMSTSSAEATVKRIKELLSFTVAQQKPHWWYHFRALVFTVWLKSAKKILETPSGKCSFHSVHSTLLDFCSSRLFPPHFIPTLSFILYKVTNDLNRTRLSYGTRHRAAKIRVSYLQDVELDYSISIFVKGTECSYKRQQIMELGNFSATQSCKNTLIHSVR